MCALKKIVCPIGYYFTGDGALRDENNDYRITGRVDDMINCKGHRIGTAELECAMVSILLSVRTRSALTQYCNVGRTKV